MSKVKMSATLFSESSEDTSPAMSLKVKSQFLDFGKYFQPDALDPVSADAGNGSVHLKCYVKEVEPDDSFTINLDDFEVVHTIDLPGFSFPVEGGLLQIGLYEGAKELACGTVNDNEILRLGNGTVITTSEADGNSRPWKPVS